MSINFCKQCQERSSDLTLTEQKLKYILFKIVNTCTFTTYTKITQNFAGNE